LRKALAFLLLASCSPAREPITQPEIMPDASPFVYPVELWDQRKRGETLLLLHVTRDGQVDSVQISHSSGEAAFDSAAMAGGRKLRFVPGKLGERPVDMWTKLPVRFSLDSTTVR
jgi:periplasmic protein TonB